MSDVERIPSPEGWVGQTFDREPVGVQLRPIAPAARRAPRRGRHHGGRPRGRRSARASSSASDDGHHDLADSPGGWRP